MHTASGIGNHAESKNEIMTHNMDLFTSGYVEKSMERGYEQEIQLTTAIDDYGPYEFNLPPTNEYVYLPHTRLYVSGVIVNQDGTALPPVNAAAPNPLAPMFSISNLFPQTLFRQVDVHVGGVNTSSQDSLYPYKAYFETLFSYSEISKESHLYSCSAFHPDEPDAEDANNEANDGWRFRKNLLTNDHRWEFCVPIHADIMQSPKFLPPNCPVKIVLTRNTDAFCMIAAAGAQLKIRFTSMRLYVRKIIPAERVRSIFTPQLEKKPVILPFSRSILKRETIEQGATNKHLILFNGTLPRQILIGLVDSRRVDGRFNFSPFKFQHYTLNHVNLRINGLSEPCRPYEPNFANGTYIRELRALYDNVGILTRDGGFKITKQEFLSQSLFFAWDNTPDHCNGFHVHDKKIGKTVDLDLRFADALPNAVNIIVYATYETEIQLLNGQVVEASFVNG